MLSRQEQANKRQGRKLKKPGVNEEPQRRRPDGEPPPFCTAADPASAKKFRAIGCALLVIATLAVYFQTFTHQFVFYDDNWYVYENGIVKAGLSVKNLVWALTTFYFANWHPLTWISYLLDNQFFGLNAGAEHAVNVFFHVAAAVTLFLALLRMTRQTWPCLMVAGIFALHPLHVESVAWISERKDVLSTFFQMLTLLFFARYVEQRTFGRYVCLAVAFLMSLLAKPMAVTLPFVMLLLDVWPLRRWKRGAGRSVLKGLVWEKVPLFAMAAGASVLTFLAQRHYGAVMSLAHQPFSARIANAAVAYVSYIRKALWPVDLAVLYPLAKPSPDNVFTAVMILAAVSAVAVLSFRRRPYLLVGWLWYLGMLVPVIGLIQVGVQSMADRYTYVPLVGLSIALLWVLTEFVAPRPLLRALSGIAAILVVILMAAATYRQAGYWKDSRTLFERTLLVTKDNYIIQNNLGVVLAGEERSEEAKSLYRQAVAENPDYAEAHANLGHELLKSGQLAEAFTEVSESLRLKPEAALAQAEMGVLLAAQSRYEEARLHLEKSIRLEPANAEAQSNLCFVLQHLGRPGDAIAFCKEAIRLKPEFLDAHFNYGNVLAAQGQRAAAAAEFSRVLAAQPNHAAARAALDGLPAADAAPRKGDVVRR